MATENPLIPATQHDKNFIIAPLVHLVDSDPAKMNPEQLAAYLTQLREARGNAATVRAKTNVAKPKPGSGVGVNIADLL